MAESTRTRLSRTLSLILQPYGSCGHKPCWLSRLEVLRTHLSGAGLKSWDARCGVQTLCFSGRSSGFWVPYQLWVNMWGLGFVMRLYSSLSYVLWCGLFLIHPMYGSCSASSWGFSQRKVFVCSCGSDVSMGEGKFRGFLCCHLDPELKFLCNFYFITLTLNKYSRNIFILIRDRNKCLWEFCVFSSIYLLKCIQKDKKCTASSDLRTGGRHVNKILKYT